MEVRNTGDGVKLLHHDVDRKQNGVGVIWKDEYMKSVVEVKQVSNRITSLKVEFKGGGAECCQC